MVKFSFASWLWGLEEKHSSNRFLGLACDKVVLEGVGEERVWRCFNSSRASSEPRRRLLLFGGCYDLPRNTEKRET